MNEKQLTKQVCDYLKWQYRDVIFTIDTSGIKLPIGLAKQMKGLRSNKGLPDLFIFKSNKTKNGLLIEIKKEGTNLTKKNGNWASEHIKEQAEMLIKLEKEGYCACFGIGFNHIKKIIDNYIKNIN